MQFNRFCSKLGMLSHLKSPPLPTPAPLFPFGDYSHMYYHLAYLCSGIGKIYVNCECREDQDALSRYCGYTHSDLNSIPNEYNVEICYRFIKSDGSAIEGGMRSHPVCQSAGAQVFIHEFSHACLWHGVWKVDSNPDNPLANACNHELQAEGCRKFVNDTLAGGVLTLGRLGCVVKKPEGGTYTFGINPSDDLTRVNPAWCANWTLPTLGEAG
jgi:hypothetical protein